MKFWEISIAIRELKDVVAQYLAGGLVIDQNENIRIEGDVYPLGAGWGVGRRLFNALDWSTHFRDGNLPSGYSWQTTGTFDVPATVNNSIYDDYLDVAHVGTDAYYLAKAVAVQNTDRFIGIRVTPLHYVTTGIRLDDGTDSNAVYFRVRHVSNDVCRLIFTSVTAGVPTDTTYMDRPLGVPIDFYIRAIPSGGNWIPITYMGTDMPYLVYLASGAARSWSISRCGILVLTGQSNPGGRAVIDAYRDDF